MLKRVLFLFIFIWFTIRAVAGEVISTTPRCNLTVNKGIATIEYPIELPNGAGGFKPNLTLYYNSNAEDGYIGMGWQVSAYQLIEEVQPNLAYDGIVSSERSVYTLNGERIIEDKIVRDTVFYRKAIDDNTLIKRYYNGTDYVFRVVLPNGVCQEYSVNCKNIYYLTSEFDKNGNQIKYSWIQNRLETVFGKKHFLRISNITYNDGGDESETVSVSFKYKTRSNPYKKFYAGYLRSFDYVVENIQVQLGESMFRRFNLKYKSYNGYDLLEEIDELGTDGETMYEPTVFSWDSSYKPYIHLKGELSVTNSDINTNGNNWMFADCNGDGDKEMVVWKDHVVTIYEQEINGGYHDFKRTKQLFVPSEWTIIQPIIGCFFDKYNPTVLVKFKKNGRTHVGNAETGDVVFNNIGETETTVSDINNDGYDELVDCDATSAIVRICRTQKSKTIISDFRKPYGLAGGTYYNSVIPLKYSAFSSVFVTDFNGDGLVDIGCGRGYYGESHFDIYKNSHIDSDGFPIFKKDTGIDAEESLVYRAVADFNGDGLPDIFFGKRTGGGRDNETDYGVYYNRGNGNYEKSIIGELNFALSYDFTDKENDINDVRVGDFNGDGKADLLFFGSIYKRMSDFNSEWGSWQYDQAVFYTSTGETFEQKHNAKSTSNTFSGKSKICVIDINGDGIDEVCNMDRFCLFDFSMAKNNEAIGCISGFTYENNRPYITTVNAGSCDNFLIIYSELDDICSYNYTPDENVGLYRGIDNVVKTVRHNNKHYLYEYDSPLYDKTGVGFLGFVEESIKDELKNKVTKKKYSLDKATLKLLPTDEEVRIGDAIVSIIKREFATNNTTKKHTYRIQQTKQYERDYLTGLETTTEYSDFSKNGLPQTITTSYGGIVTRTIETKYNDADDWRNSLPVYTSTVWKNETGEKRTETRLVYDDRGNLTESVFMPGQKEEMRTKIKYDEYGNMTKLDSLSSNIQRSYKYKYRTGGSMLTEQISPMGISTKFIYKNGYLSKAESPLDTATYMRNGLGQTIIKAGKNKYWEIGGLSKTQKRIELFSEGKGGIYTNTVANNATVIVSKTQNTLGEKKIVEYHNGNPILTQVIGLNGDTICQKNIYEPSGRIALASANYKSGTAEIEYQKYTYDTFGRIISKESPKDTVRYIYDKLLTTQIHGRDTIITEQDKAGRVASVTKNGKTVDFVCDPMGNVISATPQDGEPVVTEYDAMGRRTLISDPSAGTILTEYDGFGNAIAIKECVHSQGDTIETRMEYDDKGLLTMKAVGDDAIKYGYDEYGRTVEVANDKHSQRITYDLRGNIAIVWESIDGEEFEQSFEYDDKNRLVGKVSPSGLRLRADYDSKNQTKVNAIAVGGEAFWQLAEENENGQPILERYGKITRRTEYDRKGMPVSDSIGDLAHYEYLFDNYGDMLQKKERHSGQEEVFLFDNHNRLNIWRTFEKDTLRKEIFAAYDSIYGNMTMRTDSGFAFNYGEYGHSPHALTSIDAPIESQQNRASRYTYTDFKKLRSATNGSDSVFITYGVDFQRRKMEIYKKDTLVMTRYYFSDYEEEHYPDGKIRRIDYITAPTGIVGVRISGTGEDTLLHAFADRFGNLVLLADGDGNAVERLAYDPWGARRNPADWTKPDTMRHILPRGYSMHEHIDCLGLINMNARVYEPATASFLSPDPLIADPDNWMNYNRYLYCLGNPVKFADPTGMYADYSSASLAQMNASISGYMTGSVYQCASPIVFGSNGNFCFNISDYLDFSVTAVFSGFETVMPPSYSSSFDLSGLNFDYSYLNGINQRINAQFNYSTNVLGNSDFVGSPTWGTLSNTNTALGIPTSGLSEYINKSYIQSMAYYTQGVSTTKPDIHFKLPVGSFHVQNVGAVKIASNVLNYGSRVLGGVGIGMTLIEIRTGQKSLIGEGGIDIVMGCIGFVPGWGWIVSGVYFGGKMAFELSGNKFW